MRATSHDDPQRAPSPRPLVRALATAGAAALAATLAEPSARAQVDINPPLPDVLLLIDTSGSMEYLIGLDPVTGKALLPGDPGAPADSKCDPTTVNPNQILNRWASLVSVLTGTISNFSCQQVQRDATFAAEYQYYGADPYDLKYSIPYHRLLSGGCTMGPGTLDPAWDASWKWWDWPAIPFRPHHYSGTNVACGTPFTQSNDGLLDTFRDQVRFSMMMFDTIANAGIGSVPPSPTPNGTTGMAGHWSYFHNWDSGGSPKQGYPVGCATPRDWEVGARNASAPPWEGRMVPFPPYAATQLEVTTTNDHIQQEILAMRPFGATPLSGLMDDALEFLTQDASPDRSTPSPYLPFGPKDDPYWKNGCRKMFVLLLSDGEPNMDMRPECSGAGCPAPTPDTTAATLFTTYGVPTYVVGFALPTAPPLTSCNNLDPVVDCNPAPAALKACCELTKIAVAGGTQKALFADDQVGLKQVLSTVLATIASASTSRTVPVFSSVSATGGQGNAAAAGYQFAATFNVPTGGKLWQGHIQRERYACQTVGGVLKAVAQPIDPSKGDDFAANINADDPAHKRQFFTVIADPDINGNIYSGRSLRPLIGAAVDGLGTHSGVVSTPTDGGSFAATMSTWPQAFQVSSGSPICNLKFNTSNASVCTQELLKWETGEPTAPFPSRDASTCPVGSSCSELGSIYHSTPAVIGPPREALRDDSYSAFALAQAKRPIMLYTASTDGQLHAFKVAAGDPNDSYKIDQKINNELWSFLPPSVLPHILPNYDQQATLLDGAPIVGDVVYERKRGVVPAWNTVLIASGGAAASGGFYYALDVTDPTSPKFLWQLSTDDNDVPLFGSAAGTPAIATIVLPDGSDVKEVAVAILPGGSSTTASGTCPRATSGATCQPLAGGSMTCTPLMASPNGFAPRTTVRCWDPSKSASRSLNVVNLKTGEIIMSFRGAAGDGATLTTNNTMVVPFSSPITGVPVPYPAQTGQIANRVYVGDADGGLWRVDLSSTNPKEWSVRLEWDAYPLATDTATIADPIQTTPVVSTDPTGNIVLLFSTGDQESFTGTSSITRVWSITETPSVSTYATKENWYIPFDSGKRVTGSMALYNGVAYFSTFTPSVGSNVCSDGFGTIWGVDFVKANASLFPNPQLVPNPANPAVKVDHIDGAAGTIIFGVAVAQTPNCSDTLTSGDPYFGTHTYLGNVTPSDTEIVWQTGPGSGINAAAVSADPVMQGLQRYKPTQVGGLGRIDSWAGIVE